MEDLILKQAEREFVEAKRALEAACRKVQLAARGLVNAGPDRTALLMLYGRVAAYRDILKGFTL